jgi:hypothetical protein
MMNPVSAGDWNLTASSLPRLFSGLSSRMVASLFFVWPWGG